MWWEDRSTCILFGDRQVQQFGKCRGYDFGADQSFWGQLTVPAGGSAYPTSESTVKEKLHFIHMEGNEVFKFAVRIIGSSVIKVLENAGLKKEDIDFLVPHQANMRIVEAALKRLKLPQEKVCINLDRYGNTSSASVPIALHEALMEGRIKDGDIVVLVAFGAGLTWGSVVLRWGKGSCSMGGGKD